MLEKANSLFLRLFASIRALLIKHNCMPLMSPDPKDLKKFIHLPTSMRGGKSKP